MKFNQLSLALLITASFFASPSFAAEAMQNEKNVSTEQMQQKAISSGQTLEILMTIDKNEINAARLALKKAKNPEVRQFADMMIADHGRHLQETKKMAMDLKITPEGSEKSALLQKKGKMELSKLEALQDSPFEVAYINAMVKGHSEALTGINSVLIPNASSNPALLRFLKMTGAVVEHHLKVAQSLQKNT